MQLSTYSQTIQPATVPEEVQPAATAEVQSPAEVVTEVSTTVLPEEQQPAEQPNSNEAVFSFEQEAEEVELEQQQQNQPSAAQTQFNWKEEIKKVDRKELLKEAGLTDFAIEMNEYLQKGGKAADYLAAKAVDYNEISDEAMVKEDLKNQFPTFTKDQINLMFSRKYTTIEGADEEDKEFAALQLKADAHKIRQAKIEQQSAFVIPENPILQKDEAYEQWKQEQQSRPQLMEKLRDYFNSHPDTKSLHESKRVTISLGEGVQPFNFVIEKPEILTQALSDGGVILNKALSTKSGEPDVAKQNLVTLFSLNPQKFIQDIFNYGRSMGVKKELVEEGQNAQRPQAIVAEMPRDEKPTYKTSTYGGAK